jgi:hypothetical protein
MAKDDRGVYMNMNGKLNGYLQWVVIAIAVGSIIWSASSIKSDVKYIQFEMKELKTNQKIELEMLRNEIKELRLELRILQKQDQL